MHRAFAVRIGGDHSGDYYKSIVNLYVLYGVLIVCSWDVYMIFKGFFSALFDLTSSSAKAQMWKQTSDNETIRSDSASSHL